MDGGSVCCFSLVTFESQVSELRGWTGFISWKNGRGPFGQMGVVEDLSFASPCQRGFSLPEVCVKSHSPVL